MRVFLPGAGLHEPDLQKGQSCSSSDGGVVDLAPDLDRAGGGFFGGKLGCDDPAPSLAGLSVEDAMPTPTSYHRAAQPRPTLCGHIVSLPTWGAPAPLDLLDMIWGHS